MGEGKLRDAGTNLDAACPIYHATGVGKEIGEKMPFKGIGLPENKQWLMFYWHQTGLFITVSTTLLTGGTATV